jgi:hypothetical protein
MSYTVVIDGISIQCDTAAAAIALVRETSATGATVGTHHGKSDNGTGGAASRWTEQRVREFFRAIKPQQRKLIDALLDTTDARTDAQLCQVLGLPDGRALAGVLTGLFKNAKKVGADPREIYVKQAVTISDRRQFEYTLTESFRSAAKKWRP